MKSLFQYLFTVGLLLTSTLGLAQIPDTQHSNGIAYITGGVGEGETTAMHIAKLLHSTNIKVTRIARGLPMGGDLEYADEITLGRSIATRIPYANNLTK